MKDLQRLIGREDDYTVRLHSEDSPKEESDVALFLHFDGDSCLWVLLRVRRVPCIRKLNKSEKKHLLSKRWLIFDKVEFRRFQEARQRLIEETDLLKCKSYAITVVASGLDLPPW